jgi:hypothetical protein
MFCHMKIIDRALVRAGQLGFGGKSQFAARIGASPQVINNWLTRDIPASEYVRVADALLWGVDMLLGRVDAADFCQNDLERQLLKFYRGINAEKQDDLIAMASRWYSAANPNDKANNPFPQSPPPIPRRGAKVAT